jgi:hypothetical protein
MAPQWQRSWAADRAGGQRGLSSLDGASVVTACATGFRDKSRCRRAVFLSVLLINAARRSVAFLFSPAIYRYVQPGIHFVEEDASGTQGGTSVRYF